MTRVVVASIADDDTAEILSYLAVQAGPRIAVRYARMFEGLYERLAIYPDSGPARPALGPNVRIGIVLPYIVIYEHHPGEGLVTILRIVHGSRKIAGTMLTD